MRMVPINEIIGEIEPLSNEQDSVLITCASFEERSTAVVQRFSPGYSTDHTFIFRSTEYGGMGKSPAYFELLQNKVNRVSKNKPTLIEFSIDHSIPSMIQFETLYRRLKATESVRSVSVDITTFPRQELLMLLRVLDSESPAAPIRLFYGEPDRYNTEDARGWLTRGVKSVRPVPGFGGIQPPNKKKNLLIMFLGHEDERAAITWKRHQPRKTVAIFPDPNYRTELNGIVERTHQPLFTKLSATEFYPAVPARGIEESEKAVLRIWDENNESYYMAVAPLGTKLQTLGVYRAVRQRPDIQITYAIPSIYNYENYSVGTNRLWEISWT